MSSHFLPLPDVKRTGMTRLLRISCPLHRCRFCKKQVKTEHGKEIVRPAMGLPAIVSDNMLRKALQTHVKASLEELDNTKEED